MLDVLPPATVPACRRSQGARERFVNAGESSHAPSLIKADDSDSASAICAHAALASPARAGGREAKRAGRRKRAECMVGGTRTIHDEHLRLYIPLPRALAYAGSRPAGGPRVKRKTIKFLGCISSLHGSDEREAGARPRATSVMRRTGEIATSVRWLRHTGTLGASGDGILRPGP